MRVGWESIVDFAAPVQTDDNRALLLGFGSVNELPCGLVQPSLGNPDLDTRESLPLPTKKVNIGTDTGLHAGYCLGVEAHLEIRRPRGPQDGQTAQRSSKPAANVSTVG